MATVRLLGLRMPLGGRPSGWRGRGGQRHFSKEERIVGFLFSQKKLPSFRDTNQKENTRSHESYQYLALDIIIFLAGRVKYLMGRSSGKNSAWHNRFQP